MIEKKRYESEKIKGDVIRLSDALIDIPIAVTAILAKSPRSNSASANCGKRVVLKASQ